MDTGLRVNEIANLEIPAFNWITNMLTIETRNANRYVGKFKTKTKAGNRPIPLEKLFASELRAFIGTRTYGYVFLSQKGQKPYRKESIINMINSYAKECSSLGHSIGMHSLRRTFCSFMAKKQIPMGKLSKMMGHKDLKTTFLYLYKIDDLEDFDDVRQAVREMHE